MQIGSPLGDHVNDDHRDSLLEIAAAFGSKRPTAPEPVLIRRADQLDSRSQLWSSQLFKDANLANLEAGKVHAKEGRLGRRQRAVAVALVAPGLSLLKVGDVNLNGWPESDFRLGEKLSRKDFAIEVLSDVRRPSVVESLAMTPTSQGRVEDGSSRAISTISRLA